MSKDQAARIAAFSWTATIEPDNCELARRIRRAISTAVRKERERCVGIVVKAEANARDGGESEMCNDIIEKINGGKR